MNFNESIVVVIVIIGFVCVVNYDGGGVSWSNMAWHEETRLFILLKKSKG